MGTSRIGGGLTVGINRRKFGSDWWCVSVGELPKCRGALALASHMAIGLGSPPNQPLLSTTGIRGLSSNMHLGTLSSARVGQAHAPCLGGSGFPSYPPIGVPRCTPVHLPRLFVEPTFLFPKSQACGDRDEVSYPPGGLRQGPYRYTDSRQVHTRPAK